MTLGLNKCSAGIRPQRAFSPKVCPLRAQIRGFIGGPEAAYLLLLLGHVASEGKERGLERLCGHYQRGYRLKDPHPFQQAFTALLYNATPSVRRWALNAIAVAGSRSENLQPVLDAIARDRANDDILAAGIGALIFLTKEEERPAILRKIDVALEGATLLAAAQQAPVYQGELARRRVNIDIASAPELRLASVLVGLDKAPEHLFELGHKNSAVIGRLNGHPDPMVAQYSAWAICEHPALDLSNMASPIEDIESRPERVRAYTYRLLTADPATAQRYREYVELGSSDPSPRARGGLAVGLSKAYFDGLEEITVDWHTSEQDVSVKDAVLDHMVAHSHRSDVYYAKALDEYTEAGIGALKRARMEAAAEGLPIFGEFRKIALRGESLSLFPDAPLFGGKSVTNNFSAQNLNVGMVAGDGAKVEGGVNTAQVNYAAEVVGQLQALKALLQSAEGGKEIEEGKQLIAAAEATPSKGTIDKVLGWMKQLKEGTGYAVATTEAFGKTLEALGSLAEKLPM